MTPSNQSKMHLMMLIACLTLSVPTLAFAQDADGDGLSDADELNTHNSDPNNVDTDGDGLSDSAEVLIYNTNPILKDSDTGGTDDFTEILSGTNPSDAADDGSQPSNAQGALCTWVQSPATMNSVATAEARFNAAQIANTRSFISPVDINYTDRTTAHGPFGQTQTSVNQVWGTEPTYYAVVFSGHIVVPAATQANPNNQFTFATSSDDGMRFRIFDGTAVQSAIFDGNRGMATGPLVTVDFPDEGGVYPYDVMTWEQGGAFGLKLSWAPGTVATFSEAAFSLVPKANMAAPDLVSTQILVDTNGGTVAAADTIEATATIKNDGQSTAYNVMFLPKRLTNLTFVNFSQLPVGATVDANDPQKLNIPLLNPGQELTITYTMTVDAALAFSAQADIIASISSRTDLGVDRIRILTDNPRTNQGTDTGNKSLQLFPDGEFDDDPNTFNINDDLAPPAVAIQTPADNAPTNDDPVSVTGSTEAGATVQVVVTDNAGNIVFDGPATVTLNAWEVDVPALADGTYSVTATATDASGNEATDTHTFTKDIDPPVVTIDEPVDGSTTSDNTPTISGTSEPNSSIALILSSGETATVMADVQGNWTYTPMTAINDGAASVEATPTDEAGNVGQAVVNNFTVDTTTTITITDPAMAGTTTTDNTPTLSGTAEPNADITVSFYQGNNPPIVVTTTAANNGTWSVTPPTSLADGPYTIDAEAQDAVGNSDIASTTLTVDSTVPAITITTPANGSSTNDNTPDVTGTTESNTSVSVIVRDNAGNIVATLPVTSGPQGDYSITVPMLNDGTYTVEATATDMAGNTSPLAGPNTFTVDTSAPTLTLDTPANASTGNDNTPTISGLTDPNAEVTLTISDLNGVVQTLMATADAAGNYSVDAATLGDGAYTVSAMITDAAGNTAAAGPNAFTVDTTAPAVALVTPADGTQTNNNVLTITGTADQNTTLSVTIVDGNNNPIQTLSPVVDAAGNWTIDSNQLPDGDYSISVTATDVAGNTASDGPNQVVVDTSAPALTLDTPANGTFTNDDTPTLGGSGDVGAVVTLTILDANNNLVETLSPTVDAQGNYSVDASQLPEGTYTVTATTTDAAGNTTTEGPNTFAVDLTDPTITIDNPADGSVTSNVRPNVTGSTEAGSSVTVTITDANNNVVHTATVPADGATGNWSVNNIAMDLVDGLYNIDATATDEAGNTANTTGTFTVDTTAAPLTITAPTPGQSVTDTTPDVTGTTAPNAVVNLTITDSNGMTVETLTVTADANGDWTTALSMLADGNYNVTATVTNAAGTTTTENTNFTIDTVAPTLTVIEPLDGTITNDDTPTISGTTDPGAAVTVNITDANNNVVQTLMPVPDGMGGWTIDASQLPEGSYTIDVQAEDAAGNITSAPSIGITVDVTAPTVGITAPTTNQVINTRDTTIEGRTTTTDVLVEILDANGIVVDTQTVTADANGDWSAPVQGLDNGDYTARATVTDDAGNSSVDERPFTIDSTDPIISIATPSDNSTTNDASPTISGQADVGATLVVVIKDDAGNIVDTLNPTVDAQGNWTVDPTQDLGDGVYTIEASSTLPNGKTATATATVTVDTTTPDTTITAPGDGMKSADTQPAITGTSEPGADVLVTVTNSAGMVVFEDTVTADENGDWTITPDTALVDDDYTIGATATDEAGNTASATPVTFTVDTNAPTVTITSPTTGDTIEDDTPTVSGTAEPGAVIDVLIDGVKVGEATADANGDWTFDVPDALGEGEHTIEAKTIDGAGNEGSSGEITITVKDPKAPVVITSPTDGGTVTGPDVVVTGTGQPGEEVTVTVNGQDTTVIVDENGDWTVTVKDVPEGTTTISAKSGDDETTVTITVDEPELNTLIYAGNGCTSTPSGPVNPLPLLLLGMFAALVGWRRRA